MPVRLPDPTTIGIGSLRPAGPGQVADTSGLASGAAGFARGVGQAADALDQMAGQEQAQENTVDLARAEAYKTKQWLGIQTDFSTDPDYATFGERAEPRINESIAKAAELIRDPRMRERWLAQAETDKLNMLDAVLNVGRGKKMDAERGALITSLGESGRLIADPGVPKEVRDKAEQDIKGSIYMAVQTGLIPADKAAELTDQYVRGSENALALNVAQTDIATGRAADVVRGMAIPGADTGTSVLIAQSVVDGNAAPVLDYDLAKITAQSLGDANFPTDPKEAEAYLTDPSVAQTYAEAAQANLLRRYKGDLGAVVIAMDPKGGTALADRWVSSDHNERVLPRPVQERYRQVMGALTAQQPYQRIPVVADGVDVRMIDANVLDRFERLQSTFGAALPLVAGAKSDAVGTRGVTFDVAKLSDEERAKVVEMASAMGFTGIGIGKDTITLDATGKAHAWNMDGGNVPGWARDVVANHLAGKTAAIPALITGVAPEYQALTYDQRLQLYGQAKQAMSQSELSLKTSLQTVVDNAPAAFAATGRYDGKMPTRLDFIQAYGAVEGTQRGQAFDRAIDTSKLIFNMKTMSNQDIEKAVKAQAPLTSGNTAAMDAQRYKAVTDAAQSTLDARAKDPAGYVASAFPAVQQAWAAASKDPSQLNAALSASAQAQQMLGIEDQMLLPKAMADSAVTTFKDTTKKPEERVGGVYSLVMASKNPAIQKAVFDQLLKADLPPMTQGVMAAMSRGDTNAATTLIRAVLLDPTKMGPKFSDEATTAKIADEIQAQVFGPNQIGNVIYGASGGTTGALDHAGADITLMDRAAKLRLIDGSAKDAAEAVRLTIKDMYGDVQVLTGTGGIFLGIGNGAPLKVTVPAGTDQGQVRLGFTKLQPLVKQTIVNTMMQGISANGRWPEAASDLAQSRFAAQSNAETVLAEGWFENAGDGQYTFYDPYSDGAVPSGKFGPDGKPLPLIFTLDQVMSYGKPAPGPNQPGGGY